MSSIERTHELETSCGDCNQWARAGSLPVTDVPLILSHHYLVVVGFFGCFGGGE